MMRSFAGKVKHHIFMPVHTLLVSAASDGGPRQADVVRGLRCWPARA
jgi:hypothetical protein